VVPRRAYGEGGGRRRSWTASWWRYTQTPITPLSDGAQSLTFESFERMMRSLERIGAALGRPLAVTSAGMR